MAQAREEGFSALKNEIIAFVKQEQKQESQVPLEERLRKQFERRFRVLFPERFRSFHPDDCFVSACLLSTQDFVETMGFDSLQDAIISDALYPMFAALNEAQMYEKAAAIFEQLSPLDRDRVLRVALQKGNSEEEEKMAEFCLNNNAPLTNGCLLEDLLRPLEAETERLDSFEVSQERETRLDLLNRLLRENIPVDGILNRVIPAILNSSRSSLPHQKTLHGVFVRIYAVCARDGETILEYASRASAFGSSVEAFCPALEKQFRKTFEVPFSEEVKECVSSYFPSASNDLLPTVESEPIPLFAAELRAERAAFNCSLPELVRLEGKAPVLTKRLQRMAKEKCVAALAPDEQGESLLGKAIDSKSEAMVDAICTVLESRRIEPDAAVLARVGQNTDPISQRIRNCSERVSRGNEERQSSARVRGAQSSCCMIQ